MILKPADYPLKAVGPNVYARTYSSPIFVAMDDHMAKQLVALLNKQAPDASGWPHGNPHNSYMNGEHMGMDWRR